MLLLCYCCVILFYFILFYFILFYYIILYYIILYSIIEGRVLVPEISKVFRSKLHQRISKCVVVICCVVM